MRKNTIYSVNLKADFIYSRSEILALAFLPKKIWVEISVEKFARQRKFGVSSSL